MDEINLRHLSVLISQTSAARGVDYYVVTVCGIPAAEWATMTDRNRSTVSRNVSRARDQIEP